MLCVYCTEDKTPSYFRRREHVIPQSFGRFSPNNLILYKCVCDECNDYFGKKLELFLGRDTVEGIERLRHGIIPKESLRERRRLKSRVAEGEWKGVIVTEKHSPERGTIGLEKVAQAGFYNKQKKEYIFFELEKIPAHEELNRLGCETKGTTVLLVARKGEELNSLINKLRDNGINISSSGELIKENDIRKKVIVETEAMVDRVIFRAFAKIAFNYATYVAGRDFMLSSDFDGIRKFIRYDQGRSARYFAINGRPILRDDQEIEKFGLKITEGHLVIVEWKGNDIQSKVSLFNNNTYLIRLCSNFRGIWRPIRSGHHFDVRSKKVTKLRPISRKLLI